VAKHFELPPTPVTVIYHPSSGLGRRLWQGQLSRLDGAGFDERTRTVACRAIVSTAQEAKVESEAADGSGPFADGASGPKALIRGMFVKILVHIQPDRQFLRVPESALQPGKHLLRVLDSQLSRVGPVTLVRQVEEVSASGRHRAFLVPEGSGGLREGDHIVVSPLATAPEGMRVREEPNPRENRKTNAAAAPPATSSRPDLF
jgi:multidrug efflux pump subunit AcrA (membrane-fusion protein)